MFKRLLAYVGKLIGRAHASPATSDRNLTAQFDDAVRRQAEIFHRTFRIAQHPGEQFFAPDRHARLARRDQSLARQEKARLEHLELDAAARHAPQRGGHVDRLHKRSEEHTSELQSLMSHSYADL